MPPGPVPGPPPFPAPPVITPGSGGGLPAYTMPAASPTPPGLRGGSYPPTTYGGAESAARFGGGRPDEFNGYGGANSYGGVNGYGGTAVAGGRPDGGAAPVSAMPVSGQPVSGQPSSGRPSGGRADGPGPVVPHQRGQGTVYGRTGAQPAIDMTMPVSHHLDNSGSLTGHILAQGWHDTPESSKNSNVKVIVVMLVVILALVGMSVLFLLTAGDAVSDLFRGLFGG